MPQAVIRVPARFECAGPSPSGLAVRSVVDFDQNPKRESGSISIKRNPAMDQYRSTGIAPHRPEPIDSPFCDTCGNPLRLIRVERVLADREKHTLECPRCGQSETIFIAQPARDTI